MNWRKAWREQVQQTGELWVDRVTDGDAKFDEKESELIARKKAWLKERDAEIVKSIINGTVFSHHIVNDEEHIRYRQYLAIQIQQKDQSYLEEQNQEREMIVFDEIVIQDRLVEWDIPSIEPTELDFSDGKQERKPFQYDRQGVVNYAEKWWNDYNPDYRKFDVDCTNYVSQCLRAGGAPMEHIGEKTKGWWYQGENSYSYSWSVANALKTYLLSEGNLFNAATVDEANQLEPGDVICYDWDGNGKWNHNSIVTGFDSDGQPLVNAHTTNSRNRYWSYYDSPAFTNNTQYLFFHIQA